uniref:RING-type E3 ubiquitin transferase n=1 Tax=Megaselia scalaris TaxID=36166 RepID=T1GZG2_MEGSC
MGTVIGACVPPDTDNNTLYYCNHAYSNSNQPRVYCCIKCPVCSKFVLPDDIECHLVMCLTKPRLSYNGEYFFLY